MAETESETIPVLVVTGPVGVGKTTVAEAVSDLLGRASVPHALVDLDSLRSCHPSPSSDPFHEALGLANLRAVCANYRLAGAGRLVLADVVEDREAALRGYHAAIPGAEIAIVRLRASLPTLLARLRGREVGAGLEWHSNRARELSAQMDRDRVEDRLVETDGRSVEEIARQILAEARWPAPEP